MSVGPETDRGRTLLDGLEGVFNLVEATLWRPGRDIVVVLVAEHGGIVVGVMSIGLVGLLACCELVVGLV